MAVSEAYEVSPDDSAGVAEAFRRAAAGGTVRVVRDGHPLAQIVPASPTGGDAVADDSDGTSDDAELDKAALAELEERMAALPPESGRASRVHAERFGAPTLAHYRNVYAEAGSPWPGEAFVRRHYPVADAS